MSKSKRRRLIMAIIDTAICTLFAAAIIIGVMAFMGCVCAIVGVG